MPVSVRPRIAILSAAILLAACSSSRDVIEHQIGGGLPVGAVGAPCESDDACDGDLTCGEEGESEGQCTVEPCGSNGPGAEHGCPDDAFCYVYDGDQGHACARTCETDQDCEDVNPDLACEERSATESFGLKICVRADDEEGDGQLNAPCLASAECDPTLGLTCGGDEGESRHQCVVAGCPSVGPGEEHGCAEDAFCYVYDGDEGHYCTSTCATDGDCQALNPALVCRERSATEELGLRICVPADPLPELGGLNAACTDSSECDGEAGLTCGGGGESAGQCVVEGCPSAGPGEASGCPSDAFCYVFDGDEGHYCTATCQTDADCAARNEALVCRERTSTEELGLKICVRE